MFRKCTHFSFKSFPDKWHASSAQPSQTNKAKEARYLKIWLGASAIVFLSQIIAETDLGSRKKQGEHHFWIKDYVS